MNTHSRSNTSELLLPRIFNMPGNNVPEIIEHFIQALTLFPRSSEFAYTEAVIRKLDQYRKTIISTDRDTSFLEYLREIWARDLRNLLIENGFKFNIRLRLKSVVSLLSKINRIMAKNGSLDSIKDLLGVEIIILTPGQYDNANTIKECYQVANLCISFFCEMELKDTFSLIDCKCKETSDPNCFSDLMRLKDLNPNIFIPKKSGLHPNYQSHVKDYVLTPKIVTAYQGVQFAVMHKESGIKLEFQIKTQPMREYLDTPNSPGSHALYKENFEFTKQSPQFDLTFDSQKLSRIPGFRSNILFDESGILAPLTWDFSRAPFGKY